MNSSLYEALGGSEKIKALVQRFYHHMDTLPEAKTIRSQHKADLSEANEKLFLFLVGWTGGPQLYIEKHGHPRLRARHLPFSIGKVERDEWLLCFFKAVDELIPNDDTKKIFKSAIYRLADHMRNQEE